MSAFPDDFQFSQNNLQDYVDCPRRFELRYLLRQDWPALRTAPALEFEHRTELGERFHEMIHQYLLGVPAEEIIAQVEDVELAEWWADFMGSGLLADLPVKRHAEITLAAPFAGYRLVAKYDLVAIDPGKRAAIADWKTGPHPRSRKKMADRLQSKVYPFVLVEAGSRLNTGQPILPEQVEMIYWFTSQPAEPLHLAYSNRQHTSDREYLEALVREITARPLGTYPLTPDEKKCTFCVYRSLCERGEKAGDWRSDEDEPEASVGPETSFEQIGEIEF